jgi:hypothetical protein
MMVHDHDIRGLRFATRLEHEAAVENSQRFPRQLSTVDVTAPRNA